VVLHGRIHAGKRELVLAQSEISQCEDFRTAPPCEGSTSVNDHPDPEQLDGHNHLLAESEAEAGMRVRRISELCEKRCCTARVFR
jgi:hypothetical protein